MTFEVIFYPRLYNDNIHREFFQNWFVNECARKNLAKFPKTRSPVAFFFSCRRTFVLNKGRELKREFVYKKC